MSGDWLAMGAVAALAAAGAVRRGSRDTVSPRLIRRVSRAEVEGQWAALRRRGKHRGHSQVAFRWPYEHWVEVELPLHLVDAVPMEPGTAGWQRVERYAATPGSLPPGLAFYSQRSAAKGKATVYLADGNHRANAARLRGEAVVRQYMPELEWRLFQRRGSAQRQVGAKQKVVTRGGWPWPEQTALYHGTYAMGAIERQGFRVRAQGAPAMAGGGHIQSVSTTLLPQRAASIALALDTMGRVAHGRLLLVDLVEQLGAEMPKARVDAVTAFSDWVRTLGGLAEFYTEEAYDNIMVNLGMLDRGWTYVTLHPPKIGRPYVVPAGSIELESKMQDGAYLVPPGSPLPLTREEVEKQAERQIANPSDRGAWVHKRFQGYAHGRCDAEFRLYKAFLDIGDMSHHECFNPHMIDTKVAALAGVPLDSIGVLVVRARIPRICTDERGALRLGYLEHSDHMRDDKMRSWYGDCDRALEKGVAGQGAALGQLTERDLFGRWDYDLKDPARWQGWAVSQQGERTRQSTMLYQDGEEEVRIFDPRRIEIIGAWGIDEIRKRFDLGDRLTFPWFAARKMDVRVWRSAGSANVATQAGYHRTAVAKTGASVPLRHLIKHHGELVKGKVLDFGTGRGRDCKALGKRKGVSVSCYDPHHPDAKVRKLPTGTFDLVLANYVVNVLPPAERRKVVKQMGSKVRRGGVLVLAARGCGDRQGVQSARGWTAEGDGYAQFADDGELSRFQRFYASGALGSEARDILGASFSPLQITSMPSGTALVAFRRSR